MTSLYNSDLCSIRSSVNSTTMDSRPKIEITSIGGLTLMFSDSELEQRWQLAQLPRQLRISGRFLFFSMIFQIIFLICDVLDGFASEFTISFRIFIALLTSIACFLVSSSIVIPHQMALFWITVCYGVPTLAFYCISRTNMTHFDSLFIVYGLCFFTLPKISPLDFIHSLLGNCLLVIMYCYISAFSLSITQWVVSAGLILFPASLFSYISYSSERSSRERWLLRERLQKERISVQLVPSKIQDDLNETVLESERFYKIVRPGEPSSPAFIEKTVRLRNDDFHDGLDSSSSSTSLSSTSSSFAPQYKKTQRKQIIAKGLFAWFLCAVIGIIFDMININDLIGLRLNLSTAIAIFMYSTGFTIFLVLITGQTRWLSVNVLVGLLVIYVISTMIPQDWKAFASHTLGFIVILAVLTSLFIVVGGVVLLWREVLSFIRDVLLRYPEIRADMIHLPDMKKDNVGSPKKSGGSHRVRNNSFPGPGMHSNTTVLEMLMSRELHAVPSTEPDNFMHNIDSSRNAVTLSSSSPGGSNRPFSLDPTLLCMDSKLLKIVKARRESSCYFCLKKGIHTLIPACECWSDCSEVNDFRVASTCTPFQSLVQQRDQLKSERDEVTLQLEVVAQERDSYISQLADSSCIIKLANDEIHNLRTKLQLQSDENKRRRQVDEEEFISLSNDHVQSNKQLRKLLRCQKQGSILVEKELKSHIHDLQQIIFEFPKSSSDSIRVSSDSRHVDFNNDDDIDLDWILEAPMEELLRLFEEKSVPTSRLHLSKLI